MFITSGVREANNVRVVIIFILVSIYVHLVQRAHTPLNFFGLYRSCARLNPNIFQSLRKSLKMCKPKTPWSSRTHRGYHIGEETFVPELETFIKYLFEQHV